MILEQTHSFKKEIKKLHLNQKKDLDHAIRCLLHNPMIGQLKRGDLSEVRIYKFKMKTLLTLLAYTWEPNFQKITLLKLGSHENFYRDLKRD